MSTVIDSNIFNTLVSNTFYSYPLGGAIYDNGRKSDRLE